jgi:membrane-associated protein
MDATLAQHLLANPLSPDSLLSGSGALVVLALIIFAECGLLIGFFLPGDTLLFAAGISVAVGTITTSLWLFLVLVPLAAVLGNLLGYWIGRTVGPKVFDNPSSKWFSPENVERARHFLDRWGSWSVILGRFVPIVRTLITVMAGVARMNYGRYAAYSLIGGVLWTDGLLLLGHGLGKIDWVREHKSWIDYLVVVVVVIGLIPTLYHYLKLRRARKSPTS